MNTRAMVTSLAVLALGSAGCAVAPVSAVGGTHVHSSHEARWVGPFVPAGTAFAVRLDRPIDTLASRRGEAFTARVETPLRDTRGAIVVPVGAVIHGRLASTGGDATPRIRLDFQTIETTAGLARLRATIRHAQYQTYPGPLVYRTVPAGPYYDSPYLGPYGYGYGWGWGASIGGGPWAYDVVPYVPREVRVPAGARLYVVLTHPLVVPGSPLAR